VTQAQERRHFAGATAKRAKIFPDQAMTLAAINRLVHHSTILEMNVAIAAERPSTESEVAGARPSTPQPTKPRQN
jgi:hypothetical protein